MNAVGFIVDFVLGLIRGKGLDAALVLETLRPILVEFAMSDDILDDAKRLQLQQRIHRTLRQANLLEASHG